MNGIEWSIDDPQVKGLVEAARILHRGTLSIGLALGLRTGIKAMGALGLQRQKADRAEAQGSYCFAQGIEVITGCSMLRDRMAFQHRTGGYAMLDLWGGGKHIRIKPVNRAYEDAQQIMNADEDDIFEHVEILKP